jgi:hypothetical protein
MKNALITLALVALACSFVACAEEEPEPVPGTLTVLWTHGKVATCATRGLVDLRVWIAHPSDELLNTSQTVDCPDDDSDGFVLFENVMPATYEVGVDGIAADGKVYWDGTDKVAVGDGEDVVTDEIELAERKSTLHVEWINGLWGQCPVLENDGFSSVMIEVWPTDGAEASASGSGACAEFSHLHPVSEEAVYGAVLSGLDPEEVFIVVWVEDADGNDIASLASAMDTDGNDIALENTNIPMKLDPGNHHMVSVTLSND